MNSIFFIVGALATVVYFAWLSKDYADGNFHFGWTFPFVFFPNNKITVIDNNYVYTPLTKSMEGVDYGKFYCRPFQKELISECAQNKITPFRNDFIPDKDLFALAGIVNGKIERDTFYVSIYVLDKFYQFNFKKLSQLKTKGHIRTVCLDIGVMISIKDFVTHGKDIGLSELKSKMLQYLYSTSSTWRIKQDDLKGLINQME